MVVGKCGECKDVVICSKCQRMLCQKLAKGTCRLEAYYVKKGKIVCQKCASS